MYGATSCIYRPWCCKVSQSSLLTSTGAHTFATVRLLHSFHQLTPGCFFKMFLPYIISTLLLISTTTALSAYVPYSVFCPQVPLVRPAEGLSTEERTYRTARKAKADFALKSWLRRTNPDFRTDRLLPTVLHSPYLRH